MSTAASTPRLPLPLAAMILALGAVGYVLQLETQATLRGEIAVLREQLRDLGRLRQENARLTRAVAEVEELRRERTGLAALREEAAALAVQVQKRAAATRAAASSSADTSGDVSAAGKIDRPPQPRRTVRPEYPPELRAQGISGQVVLDVVSDADGNAANVTVVRSTNPAFEGPAVAALSQWSFEPGRKGGRSVNARLQIPIAFSPKPGAPATAAEKPERAPAPGWF